MKKILLTTTALVTAAGIASAEVSVSGSAEMGIAQPSENESITLHQDIDVNFSMSTETDSGLAISASVDLDEAGKLGNAKDDQGVAIAVSAGFGTVTLGDTDGAADWATAEMSSVLPGSLTDNETDIDGLEVNGLDGNYDGQILRYDNEIGNIGFALSIERVDDTDAKLPANNTSSTPGTVGEGDGMGMGIGVKFDAGPVTLGLGIQNAKVRANATHVGATTTYHKVTGKRNRTILSASGELSGVKFAALYAMGKDHILTAGQNLDKDSNGVKDDTGYVETDIKQMHVGLAYTMDDITFGLGIFKGEVGSTKTDGNVINVSYGLGGGTNVLFAYNNEKEYSLGLSMSF